MFVSADDLHGWLVTLHIVYHSAVHLLAFYSHFLFGVFLLQAAFEAGESVTRQDEEYFLPVLEVYYQFLFVLAIEHLDDLGLWEAVEVGERTGDSAEGLHL